MRKPVDKISYVKVFKPWGWIVGTGNYTDYMQKKIEAMEKEAHDKIVSSITETIGFQ